MKCTCFPFNVCFCEQSCLSAFHNGLFCTRSTAREKWWRCRAGAPATSPMSHPGVPQHPPHVPRVTGAGRAPMQRSPCSRQRFPLMIFSCKKIKRGNQEAMWAGGQVACGSRSGTWWPCGSPGMPTASTTLLASFFVGENPSEFVPERSELSPRFRVPRAVLVCFRGGCMCGH